MSKPNSNLEALVKRGRGGRFLAPVALRGGMDKLTDTTYVVTVTIDNPEAVGQAAAALAAAGFTEVRFSALERGQQRALSQDELGVALQVVARATDARRAGAETGSDG